MYVQGLVVLEMYVMVAHFLSGLFSWWWHIVVAKDRRKSHELSGLNSASHTTTGNTNYQDLPLECLLVCTGGGFCVGGKGALLGIGLSSDADGREWREPIKTTKL